MANLSNILAGCFPCLLWLGNIPDSEILHIAVLYTIFAGCSFCFVFNSLAFCVNTELEIIQYEEDCVALATLLMISITSSNPASLAQPSQYLPTIT